MKNAIYLWGLLLTLVVLTVSAHAEYTQGESDELHADTIDFVWSVVPNALTGDSILRGDLYIFNDGNEVVTA